MLYYKSIFLWILYDTHFITVYIKRQLHIICGYICVRMFIWICMKTVWRSKKASRHIENMWCEVLLWSICDKYFNIRISSWTKHGFQASEWVQTNIIKQVICCTLNPEGNKKLDQLLLHFMKSNGNIYIQYIFNVVYAFDLLHPCFHS